jgi:hypothetical protein
MLVSSRLLPVDDLNLPAKALPCPKRRKPNLLVACWETAEPGFDSGTFQIPELGDPRYTK